MGIAEKMKAKTPAELSAIAKKSAATRKQKKDEAKKEAQRQIGDFEIRYDLQIPPGRGARYYKFLEEIKVGGCVIVKDKEAYGRLYSAASSYGKRTDKTFAGRTLRDGTFGIWRVK